MTSSGAAPIVFYDGVCGLCNGFVRWALVRDVRERFRFAPLQGEAAAREFIALPDDPGSWTIVLRDEDGVHQGSTAVIRILADLPGAWPIVAALMRVVPPPVRDAFYRMVARRRYGWFGRLDACPVPTATQRRVMLP